MTASSSDTVIRALNNFRIELPSWGFANTGTRFGKFIQPAAATTTEEKFSDAGQVHSLTGACPTVALHVLWDFPNGIRGVTDIPEFSSDRRASGINQSQFSFRSRNTSTAPLVIRIPSCVRVPLGTRKDSIEIAKRLHSREHFDVVCPMASNYPGTANIRQRKRWFENC